MTFQTFSAAIEDAKDKLRTQSHLVENAKWQSVEVKHDMHTYEVLNHSFTVDNRLNDLLSLASHIRPNLPWADDHFEERVCGYPINPGLEWENWPFNKSADRFRSGEKFNHNYMERYWPRAAGAPEPSRTPKEYQRFALDDANRGIYHRYGDLEDIIIHLIDDPTSRQAYMPVWFPEDTGAHHGGRVPCTLGYHFIMRANRLHIVYYLRSCDFVRHFRDDIYLTVRLQLWLLDRLRRLSNQWLNVEVGSYTMHITSLHVFKADWVPLFGEPHGQRTTPRIQRSFIGKKTWGK